jgi:hypothetical protein
MESIVAPWVAPDGKEYWQTEASEVGNEKWGDAKQASSVLSRYLADMNHLASTWFFHVGIKGVPTNWLMDDSSNTALYMMLYRIQEKDWGRLLKCWYFQQASQTFKKGTSFRKAYTNLRQENSVQYNLSTDSTMVYAYGKKAPLYCAAGVNSNGSWGIAMTNYTGVVDSTPLSQVRQPTDFKVTVHVNELAGQGSIQFTGFRCNATAPYIHSLGAITMSNGDIVVDSLGSFDMITLLSPPVGTTRIAQFSSINTIKNQLAVRVLSNGNNCNYEISFSINEINTRVSLEVFDLMGRRTAVLLNETASSGSHHVVWDGRSSVGSKVGAGVYCAVLRYGSGSVASRFVINK